MKKRLNVRVAKGATTDHNIKLARNYILSSTEIQSLRIDLDQVRSPSPNTLNHIFIIMHALDLNGDKDQIKYITSTLHWRSKERASILYLKLQQLKRSYWCIYNSINFICRMYVFVQVFIQWRINASICKPA